MRGISSGQEMAIPRLPSLTGSEVFVACWRSLESKGIFTC